MENYNELQSFAALAEDYSTPGTEHNGDDQVEEIHEFDGQDVEESVEAFQILVSMDQVKWLGLGIASKLIANYLKSL